MNLTKRIATLSTTSFVLGSLALAQIASRSSVKTGYAPVDGLKVYYEIRGTGAPLVVLHGGLGSTDMMSPIVTALAADRQVIALDLQGHGRTGDIDRPITYEGMADDIAGLMKYLGIEKADVLGYSLGGGTALRVAIQHPNLARRLILISMPYKRDGWYPEIRAAMDQMGPASAEQMKASPLYQNYAKVAPNPADWTTLVTKLGELLRKDYDWSAEVAAIKSPVLLVFGDADAVRTAHSVEFFELLGGGKKDAGWDGSGMSSARLAILPGATHYNILASPLLVPVVTQFLDAPGSRRN